MVHIIVERRYEPAFDLEGLAKLIDESGARDCLHLYHVDHRATFHANDGGSGVCFYVGPDTEAVRAVQRTANLPYMELWRSKALGEDPVMAQTQGRPVCIATLETEGMDAAELEALGAEIEIARASDEVLAGAWQQAQGGKSQPKIMLLLDLCSREEAEGWLVERGWSAQLWFGVHAV